MHPLARSSRPASARHVCPQDTPVSQWAKTVPIKETILEHGQEVEVFNLRQRITILSPSYDFSVTEYYLGSYNACLHARARYRMPDGTVQLLPIIADRVNVPNDSHVDRARNVVANVWVDKDETDLAYWWDVDIELHPEHILRIFQHLMNGHDFVCGHYAMKCLAPMFVANVKAGAKPDPESGLIELMDGGTGAMAWHRRVPLKLRQHAKVKPYLCAPNSPFANKIHWAYFSSGVYGAGVPLADLAPEQRAPIDDVAKLGACSAGVPQWLSEDWMVCRLWQELGGRVMGDTHIKLRHFGRMMYPPSVDELESAYHHILAHHHPAIKIEKLRQLAAAYSPPPPPKDPAPTAEVIPFEQTKAA
jgi:hypothetical protein